MLNLKIACFVTLSMLAACSVAQEAPTAVLTLPGKTAVLGSKIKAKLKVHFAPGMHGYQNPPSQKYQIPVAVEAADKNTKLGKIEYPKGVELMVGGEKALAYEGDIEIPVEIVLLTKKQGKLKIQLKFKYQQCNDQSCFPPGEIVATADLELKPAPKPKK